MGVVEQPATPVEVVDLAAQAQLLRELLGLRGIHDAGAARAVHERQEREHCAHVLIIGARALLPGGDGSQVHPGRKIGLDPCGIQLLVTGVGGRSEGEIA